MDPITLLRLPGAVAPYPIEPSDAELAARAGLPVEAIVRYDMNTLGGGALPAVAAAAADWDARRAVEYGDLAYRALRSALASLTGVPPERIVPGAGADELIRLVTTAVAGPGDAVLVPTPTFGMFAVEARLAGARVVELPREHPGLPQSAEAIRAAAEAPEVRLVWLCNPNNPTGDARPLDDVRRIAAGLPAIVVVDEVYLEFAEASTGVTPESTSAARLQDELPNVLVLRSLAKAYGLAGARVGYLLVPARLAERFDAIRLPLSVSAPSEALALGALTDLDRARLRHREIVSERERLEAALRELGCEVLSSVTNFVTFRPPDAVSLFDGLLRRGLVLRDYPPGPMGGWLRATARARDENDRLIASLRELLG